MFSFVPLQIVFQEFCKCFYVKFIILFLVYVALKRVSYKIFFISLRNGGIQVGRFSLKKMSPLLKNISFKYFYPC